MQHSARYTSGAADPARVAFVAGDAAPAPAAPPPDIAPLVPALPPPAPGPRRRRWWPAWRLGMTGLLAWRNLVQDRARLAVTLVGILFSVVLMAVQSGLLLGFAATASSLVDHAGADLWITPHGTRNVDRVASMSERQRFKALEVPGVAAAREYIVQFADWRRPDGGTEVILLVGFNPKLGMGGPWRLAAGAIEDLEQPDAIMIDTLYREKLGVTHLGQIVEIAGHRARVVGFTTSIRTFTQAPYIFTSLKNARLFGAMNPDEIKYILVKLAPDADRESVRHLLSARLPDCDVLDAATFARTTQVYWLFSTGAGTALVIAAALGLFVGIMIVAQTLYANTIDRLPHYATLRAMGAGNGYLYRIIIKQAVISAVIGYALGIAVTLLLSFAARNSNTAILIPVELVLVLAVATILMCSAAALISIKKVTGIDPVSVFR